MVLKEKEKEEKRKKKKKKLPARKKISGLNIKDLNNVVDAQVKQISNKLSNQQNLTELQGRSPIIWVTRNIYTEKGEPMEFRNRPYLVDIYKDFSPHIVVKKGAQIGLTQLSVAKSLYVADNNNMTIIYTFPTETHVQDFSKARFKSIISQSAYLRSRIKNIDTVGLKEIGNSQIYFRGTISQKQAISIPSDLNIHDELDFSSLEVRNIYSARLSVSKYKWEWDFSTPTHPRFGIDDLWRDSDKHVWVAKCTGCNKFQQINFFRNVFKRPKRSGERRYYFGCRYCQKRINRRKGEWVSLKPKKEMRGYFVPQEICSVISAKYMVDEYKKAKKEFGGLKKFYNFNLGKAYESGEDRITKSMILDKVVAGTVNTGKICIGADQGDILHVVVSKLTDKRRIIHVGKLSSIEELVNMIRHYNSIMPTVCVLDAQPNHNDAVKYANKVSNLYLCYYDDKSKVTDINNIKVKEKIQSEKAIHIGRTDVLDHTASLWTSGQTVIENYINPHTINEFADQMKNMKRDMEEDKRTQKMKAKWIRIGQDHYRHADAYNFLASELHGGRNSDLILSSGAMSIQGEMGGLFGENEVW